jgi:hypothetical protein
MAKIQIGQAYRLPRIPRHGVCERWPDGTMAPSSALLQVSEIVVLVLSASGGFYLCSARGLEAPLHFTEAGLVNATPTQW